jgi:hypothetical protein
VVGESQFRQQEKKLALGLQGGSDISGTLSKLHIPTGKKIIFLIIILRKTISALCRSRNENKQTHSSKATRAVIVSILCAGWTMKEIMNREEIKKDVFKRSFWRGSAINKYETLFFGAC